MKYKKKRTHTGTYSVEKNEMRYDLGSHDEDLACSIIFRNI